MELTEKEKIALEAFQEGMDEPNAGWLHEIAPFAGKELSGVVSSLVKKGVITSDTEIINQDPSNVCHWIQVCIELERILPMNINPEFESDSELDAETAMETCMEGISDTLIEPAMKKGELRPRHKRQRSRGYL